MNLLKDRIVPVTRVCVDLLFSSDFTSGMANIPTVLVMKSPEQTVCVLVSLLSIFVTCSFCCFLWCGKSSESESDDETNRKDIFGTGICVSASLS